MPRKVAKKVDKKVAYRDGGEPNEVEAIRLLFQKLVNSGVSYREVALSQDLVVNTVRYYFKGARDVDGATIGFMEKLISYIDSEGTNIHNLKNALEETLSSDTSSGLAKKTGATQQNIDLYKKGKLSLDKMTLGFAERLLYGRKK